MSTAIMARPAQISYSQQQLDLIKAMYAKGASNDEFLLFVELAKHRGLDVFKRQICLIGFYDKDAKRKVFQPVVTIDGLRSKAEATKSYRGQTPPQWCGEDGAWVDVWLKKEPPSAARVGVYRAGFEGAQYAVARFDSYAKRIDGRLVGQWATMWDLMIAKCAEALALRKTFPDELGGLYTRDEMEQRENDTPKYDAEAEIVGERFNDEPMTEEQHVNQLLMDWCITTKGTKNDAAQKYFDSVFGPTSKGFRKSRAIQKGLYTPVGDDAAEEGVA